MKLLYWFPAVSWAGLIFYLSSRTGNQLHRLFPFFPSFNWGHLVAYFMLSIFVAFALEKTFVLKQLKLWVVLICFLYGVSDEIHQYFVPGRTPEWGDLLNDGVGAYLGVLFYIKVLALLRSFANAQEDNLG
jgi:VanZ family protein